jgi:hypothetical protein
VKPTTEKNPAGSNPRKSTEGSKEKVTDKEKKNSRGEKRKPRDGDEKKAVSEVSVVMTVVYSLSSHIE